MTTPLGSPNGERPFTSRQVGRTNQPNLLFIMADDLGWMDLSCYGSPHISTPNLDRLAAGGIRFTDAYAGSALCSSTRISLYTGRYPTRLKAGLEEPMQTRSESNGIPADHPTLPSLLVEAGYETAMFGKWHCGWLPWFSPLRNGFQTFFGNLDGVIDYFGHVSSLGDHDLYEGETPVEMTGYYTDMISDRAAEFVAAERDRPFYLQLNYTAPHWPWEGPGDAELGADITARMKAARNPFPLIHHDGGSLAKYREMVEAMDAGIGRVLDSLAAAGRSDDTLVLFCSDNGGERWSMNWPFVGEKGDLTEGGIRVPFILRWPRAVGGNQVCSEPNITMDWTATMLSAAGTGPDLDWPLDGVDLLGWLLDGDEFPEHDLVWRSASQGALRRGRFKYVRDGRDRAIVGVWPRHYGDYHLLYDVTVDGREGADLATHEPDVLIELRQAWEKVEAELLAYPPDHPNVPHPPRRATADLPAVSGAD